MSQSLDDDDKNKTIKVGDVQMSLGDLIGINLDDVQERRFESFPKGNFNWEVELAKLGVLGEGDKAKGGIIVKCKCLEVINVTDTEFTGNPTDLVNKYFTQTFFLSTEESLGYAKAFFKDIGAPYSSNFLKLLEGAGGTRFFAPIQKRKNPNDTDQFFTQFNQQKIKPLASSSSDVAAALGGKAA